ncbi:hypothetical protein MPTK1_4g14330 [Marchantia polymorpha subsp. ruderalis]|uniref:Uncharacterized protein n=2 Tax=Marchantia polymorpha TaxID=3197 RepID=A0AAF6B9T3_MARPO|nr:hypothetical protein MARPO_0070s0049 [Marchantia polymorpha]BBN08767.1 hypothetical protein Mp_4g14330 [Marchantia polymorpha subsp. ruderalis]|eukprot:PTQ35586.1 hypothetical protein MARPO_0070s0049 [Marchantia polymorpha]
MFRRNSHVESVVDCDFGYEGRSAPSEHEMDGQCELFVEVQEIEHWQPEAFLLQQQAQAELELWPERGRQCPNCRQLNVKVGPEAEVCIIVVVVPACLCCATPTSWCSSMLPRMSCQARFTAELQCSKAEAGRARLVVTDCSHTLLRRRLQLYRIVTEDVIEASKFSVKSLYINLD